MVDLYNRSKIQTFATEWSTNGKGLDFNPDV